MTSRTPKDSWTETHTEFLVQTLAKKSHPDDPDDWVSLSTTLATAEDVLTVMRSEHHGGLNDVRFVKVETTSTHTIVFLDDPSGIGLVPPATSEYADRPTKADHNYDWHRTDEQIDREARTRPHGHVTPRPDGAKAKCRGPKGGCGGCRREAEILAYETTSGHNDGPVGNTDVRNNDVSDQTRWQPEPEGLIPAPTARRPNQPIKADHNYTFDLSDREVDQRAREHPHGHVTPRPDGMKAKCGGPGACGVCRREADILAYEKVIAPDENL